jgi:hypothetical protein
MNSNKLEKLDVHLMELTYILKLPMQKQPSIKDMLMNTHKQIFMHQMTLTQLNFHSLKLKLWMQMIMFKFILKLDHQLKIQMYVDQEVISKILHFQQDILFMD